MEYSESQYRQESLVVLTSTHHCLESYYKSLNYCEHKMAAINGSHVILRNNQILYFLISRFATFKGSSQCLVTEFFTELHIWQRLGYTINDRQNTHTCVVVDGPVASLAGVIARSGYLAEGLVQRQVVSDGVLERVETHDMIDHRKPFVG